MNAAEMFALGIGHAAEQSISYLERNGRNAAEVQIYRDLLKQVQAVAPAVVGGSQNTLKAIRPILGSFGERVTQYLIDIEADNAEIKALAPGAAAPAATRLYDALSHLVEVIDDEHRWARTCLTRAPWRLAWHQRKHRVVPSDFEVRLHGLSSAIGHVAQAANTANIHLHSSHRVFRYLFEIPETAAPAIVRIGKADGTQPPLERSAVASKGNPRMSDLRNMYIEMLSAMRTWATDIQKSLAQRDHPTGGASTYTVRDQVCRAEAMVQKMEVAIASLRWAIRPSGLRVVENEERIAQ